MDNNWCVSNVVRFLMLNNTFEKLIFVKKSTYSRRWDNLVIRDGLRYFKVNLFDWNMDY